jgi:hypothetical protein
MGDGGGGGAADRITRAVLAAVDVAAAREAVERRDRCRAPDFPAFDIDVYDCQCGHSFGDHDYGRFANGDMRINFCTKCAARETV